ncbi:MAG: hypothetical protein A4E39_00030 [Methanoregulaceae archaeon PtaB.Bin152]|nr:MAG: hypothetical protein A4E39_00030 [Methanoregulaceae archaeon PtaB.Bin152]
MVMGSSCLTYTDLGRIPARERASERMASLAMPSASIWETMVTSSCERTSRAADRASSQRLIAIVMGYAGEKG